MSQEQRVTTDDDAGPGVRVEVSRDRDAEFTAFVRDSAAYLHRTAYLLCGDGHRAEELVQSTFERVYRTWAKVRPGTQRAYARQILVNLRIDGWRHTRRELVPGDDRLPLGTTPDHGGHVALRDELVRGLAQLPSRQRKVVVLRHLLDLPEAEVARELGIAVGTVKAANSRGLARLRDLLVAGAEPVETPAVDEHAVLDRSRAALRRRRTRQAAGAVVAAVLLVVGVLTRGPVPLPWVGPVVLPGGQLLTSLLDVGPTDAVVPDEGSTPVACPEQPPAPSPTRAPTAEDGDVLLDDPVVVDAAAARPLTCFDVTVEAVTSGVVGDDGVAVADDRNPLPDPRGLSESGKIFHFGAARTDDGDPETGDQQIRTGGWSGGASRSGTSLTVHEGSRVTPTGLTVTGDRVVWSETSAPGTSPRDFLRTMVLVDGGSSALMDPLVTADGELGLFATTRAHVLWTDGPDGDRLSGTTLDGDGTPTVLGDDVTALAAAADEAVFATLTRQADGPSRAAISLVRDLGEGGLDADLVAELELDPSVEIADLAVSHDVIVWTLLPTDGGPGTLHVQVRGEGRDSIVRLPGAVDDLRVSGGLVTWTGTDGEAGTAYLYRATPSASGYDGPDLARYPGWSVRASLSGDRTAWLEDGGARQWLVEAVVAPTLER